MGDAIVLAAFKIVAILFAGNLIGKIGGWLFIKAFSYEPAERKGAAHATGCKTVHRQ